MNRYSWVCLGASTSPHPARLRNGAQTGRGGRQGGGEVPGWPRSGGSWARGAAGRAGGACVHHTRYHSHHLIWEAGLLHPSCKGEAEQDCAVFPTGAPRAGPGSGHGDDPDPMGTGRGGSPPGPPTTPTGTKPTTGCPKHRPWLPREVGGRRGGAGRHYGGLRAML